MDYYASASAGACGIVVLEKKDRLFYYSKSKDVKAGEGKNEVVIDSDKYKELNKIKNWRKILSNFHTFIFVYENFRYKIIEHCFQSQKIKLVDNNIAYNFTIDSGHIIGKGDGDIARKNRKVVMLDKDKLKIWDENKHKIMKNICYEKYKQCNEYKTILHLTQDAELWHIVIKSKYPLHTTYLGEIRDNKSINY